MLQLLLILIITTTTIIRTSALCSVCGRNKRVGNSSAVYSHNSVTNITTTCGGLEENGFRERIKPESCAFLPGRIANICDCQPILKDTTTTQLSNTTTSNPNYNNTYYLRQRRSYNHSFIPLLNNNDDDDNLLVGIGKKQKKRRRHRHKLLPKEEDDFAEIPRPEKGIDPVIQKQRLGDDDVFETEDDFSTIPRSMPGKAATAK
mmetsp:Transcript_20489/g.23385  ORF Transcript_20489/g.23385 Transcript_20489/m.23385 type:complete len:204 (+) Transcript_20489:265-876(+)